jgi:hypothetical protein
MPTDAIIIQDPSPGYPVVFGGQIQLTVNRQEGVISQPRGLYFFYYPMDNGFLKSHVILRIHCFALSYDVVDAYLRPGEDVWMVVPQEHEAVLSLYQDDELVLSHPFASSKSLTDGLEGRQWASQDKTLGMFGD